MRALLGVLQGAWRGVGGRAPPRAAGGGPGGVASPGEAHKWQHVFPLLIFTMASFLQAQELQSKAKLTSFLPFTVVEIKLI